MSVLADVLSVCTFSMTAAPVDVEGVGKDESDHDEGAQSRDGHAKM